ncbi:xanthine dehydrogenase family protein molybdopterin-binding subunit [Mycolicibacterium sp. 050158]|uniref:xanthine dehydrogenase family protein molybdopterin-binding subunit n=1 Tax=Mycolicibacterium sp. 050158 TaxID=3090602 RepID=UPI00299DF587|nr:molybdopterin cofactor-binding domain-containing protein [Mycolicibacterium sp. 050158]MDX1889635.1 molybdopterin cofactor-binding domain-containing protein [Mycolicibacterium sp. 050158]
MTVEIAADLPPSILANPMVADWVRMLPDQKIEIRSGKVELGQGVLTALAQIAAEELDVEIGRVSMLAASTEVSPDEGYTAGSLSIQHSGEAVRLAAAEARAIHLEVAARRWGVPATLLTVADGTVGAPDGRRATYWDLTGDGLLDQPVTGLAPIKPIGSHRIVGTAVPRIDLPDKLAPRPRFIHDVVLPGLLYGRIVRPPSRGAALLSIDEAPTRAIAGVVAVVRDGDFLGVVAEREEVALTAVERLRADARWREDATLPDEAQLPAFLTSAPAETVVISDSLQDGAPDPAGHHAVYHRPYLAHASMGPSAATALVNDGDGIRLRVWTHSQGVYLLRRELARALRLHERDVVVQHVEGAGCYGHNGADDVALDAALLAAAVPGRPVQVVWSRPDELGWAPFGPAAVVRIAADVDAEGSVTTWRHDVWGNGHVTRPGFVATVGLLAATHRAGGEPIAAAGEPPLERGGGATRNAVPGYDFPAARVVNHRLTVMPLRTSALRSLGAFVNVFAIESFMDELAVAAGRDPVEYRLAHLSDSRGRAVIEAAVLRSGWTDWTPGESCGHGLGYARYKNTSAYCAVVAEVEATSEIRVRRLTVAVDAGLVVNPDGVVNQVEGGAIQATSWALRERVRFDDSTVTSDTWETYPILTFSEVPVVEVEVLPGNGNPSLGVGETAQGPTAAAIANAIYDAIGVRVRDMPFTSAQIVAAMTD